MIWMDLCENMDREIPVELKDFIMSGSLHLYFTSDILNRFIQLCAVMSALRNAAVQVNYLACAPFALPCLSHEHLLHLYHSVTRSRHCTDRVR